MEPVSRLREAIKQTQIVIDETDSEDIVEQLEAALSRLENAIETLILDGAD